MKRLSFGVRIAIGTSLLLIAAFLLSRLLWLKADFRHNEATQGWFYGSIRLRIDPSGPSGSSFSLIANSTSETNWHWLPPSGFSYSTFELKLGFSETNRTVRLKLPDLTYERGGTTGSLTAPLFAKWLSEGNVPSDSGVPQHQTEWIIAILKKAHEGALPPPRHHTYRNQEVDASIPKDLNATLQHFQSGGGIWPLDWVFLVFIATGVPWFVRRRLGRLNRASMPRTS